jgi:hypothetical protein
MLTLLSLNTEGTAVAPVWSVHTNILNHKRYYDTSANNVNHVNDFMSRVYAQPFLHCWWSEGGRVVVDSPNMQNDSAESVSPHWFAIVIHSCYFTFLVLE